MPPIVTVVPAPAAPPTPPPAMACTTQAEASALLLEQLLGADASRSMLVRALGEEVEAIRSEAMKAALHVVRTSGEAKGSELLDALVAVMDHLPQDKARAERVLSAILAISGELGAHLNLGELASLLSRYQPLLSHETLAVAAGASRGMASALRGAVRSGCASIDGELKSLAMTSMETVSGAKTSEESRSGANGIGAVIGAMGARFLDGLGVMASLVEILDGGSKGKGLVVGPCAKEAAVLAIEQLSVQLAADFEPYGVPLLRQLVGLYADKERKVVEAAARSVRAMLSQLSPLAVKLVLPALYDGMEAVAWRTKVECLQALSVLAEHAPSSVGPRLPEAIPKVMECLANTNAKVVEAASAALPLLCSCVENSETQKLKPLLIKAFIDPSTTSSCLEELMCTTFVNAMDGTSLAFIMPLLLRGLNDQKYELVKKAAVSSGNVCALVKNPSEIAPFVPLFEPVLSKCCEHSSPDVRAAAEVAKQKLLDGAGGLVDLDARARAISTNLAPQLEAAVGGLPKPVASFVADLAAELLEQELGGAAKLSYLQQAPQTLSTMVLPRLLPYAAGGGDAAAALAPACAAAVADFRERMSSEAKALLTSADGKDYGVDVQNAILAFAGRVLLKGCDLRFERGRRYGLIGQNGVGKTTLLNRLAAKDITGFPTEVRTWYIRHEVVCEDGVDVRTFMKQQAAVDDATVIKTLEQVGFPEVLQTTGVTQLSGGWKMKLSIAISILQKPELLLLDEPTNHLDRNAVQWLTRHLLSLTNVTMCIVSHDYDFIDDVCTDIAHYDNGGQPGKPCRLEYYPMRFKAFHELKPEIAAGLPTADRPMAFDKGDSESGSESGSEADDGAADESTLSKVDELMASGQILPIRFPDPGKPEGIRTYRKPILTMKSVSFKYPGTDRMILTDATATLTLGSRSVLLGANGAGKSTFLKLVVGDLELSEEDTNGEAWRHHNLRVSYIAQHSLHHLEEYLESTPMAYIQERFRHGLDREVSKLKQLTLDDDEKETCKEVGQIADVIGRQTRGKSLWYEVEKVGRKKSDTQWVPMDELTQRYGAYVGKLIRNFDEKQKAIDSGMAIRPITSAEILAHLADFGIDQSFSHGKIKQLSGGQRQRLVLCAAFWSKPHLIALDEPTNYLDNDTLAALTLALKNFKGAVLTVSHNRDFVAEIANEKWIVEDGKIEVLQLRDAKAR